MFPFGRSRSTDSVASADLAADSPSRRKRIFKKRFNLRAGRQNQGDLPGEATSRSSPARAPASDATPGRGVTAVTATVSRVVPR